MFKILLIIGACFIFHNLFLIMHSISLVITDWLFKNYLFMFSYIFNVNSNIDVQQKTILSNQKPTSLIIVLNTILHNMESHACQKSKKMFELIPKINNRKFFKSNSNKYVYSIL